MLRRKLLSLLLVPLHLHPQLPLHRCLLLPHQVLPLQLCFLLPHELLPLQCLLLLHQVLLLHLSITMP